MEALEQKSENCVQYLHIGAVCVHPEKIETVIARPFGSPSLL